MCYDKCDIVCDVMLSDECDMIYDMTYYVMCATYQTWYDIGYNNECKISDISVV